MAGGIVGEGRFKVKENGAVYKGVFGIAKAEARQLRAIEAARLKERGEGSDDHATGGSDSDSDGSADEDSEEDGGAGKATTAARAPVAFFRAPSQIESLDRRGADIALGCQSGEVVLLRAAVLLT